MLWIEDIVATPPFFINSRVDMSSFVDPQKVIARRSALSAFLNARNEGESKGREKNEGLKCQFSQMEGDLNL